MTLSGLDVIARSDDFETRAAAYELRGWQWAFLCELDGAAELRDVAMAGGVDLDLAIDFVAESEAAGLVRVVSMTLRDYRRQHDIPEPESATDTLASYESAPPAWMLEHHDAVAEHDEPVAEQRDTLPEWTPDAYASDAAHEPVAEHHEPVAEHHEALAEWTPDAHIAAFHEEPVAAYHDEPLTEHHDTLAEHHEPVAEWTPDAPTAEFHEEPVAEYHDAAAAQSVSSYEWAPDTFVAEHHDEEPIEEHAAVADQAVPSYEWAPDTYVADAASTVAGLMSLQPHHDAFVEPAHAEHAEYAQAEHPELGDAHPSGQSVSLSIGNDAEATPVATNGHASNGHGSYSWQPMSLVTTVDATPVETSNETHHEVEAASDVPDGISIQLSAHPDEQPEHAATEYEPEPVFEQHEQGSISFSFAPDTEPESLEAVREPAHALLAQTSEASAPQPAVQESQGEAPQQLRMDAASAQNGKGDLVGNLIARAFSFRVK